jgi:hypothetical protein
LLQHGGKNIQQEVPIITPYGQTSLDAVCTLDGELHSWEAKCQRKLTGKCVKQLRKASSNYKYRHVFVAKDTLVSISMGRQVEQEHGDIVRADVSR